MKLNGKPKPYDLSPEATTRRRALKAQEAALHALGTVSSRAGSLKATAKSVEGLLEHADVEQEGALREWLADAHAVLDKLQKLHVRAVVAALPTALVLNAERDLPSLEADVVAAEKASSEFTSGGLVLPFTPSGEEPAEGVSS